MQSPTRASGSVLVVDDELAVLRSYVRMLTSAGFAVDSATDGIEAKRLIEQKRFDFILSDIAMPGMTGLELLHFVREHDLDVPVVLVTGTPTVQSAIKAVEDGALLYLVKPIDARALLQVAEHATRMGKMAALKREVLAHLGATERQVGDRAGLEAAFGRALKSLWVAYQPIVQWSSREIVGFEALARTEEPLLPHPDALFDAARRLGRLAELGRAVRRLVAESMREAPANVHVFVNLHPSDLADDALYAPDAPLSSVARRTVLEITERVSLFELSDVPGRIATLRGLGFQIAIDDLGAGYAGLSAFAHLSPDIVKLDMSLMRGIDSDPLKQRIVASMTTLCKEMDKRVVAEGIESVAERDAAVSAGCELMQGYLFARPGRGFPTVTW